MWCGPQEQCAQKTTLEQMPERIRGDKATRTKVLRQNYKIYLRESKQDSVDIGEQGKGGAVRDEAGGGKVAERARL